MRIPGPARRLRSRRTRSMAIAATVAATAALGAPAASALTTSQASTPGWAATGTLALHPAGTYLGATPATRALTVSVALRMRDMSAATRLAQAMATPGSPVYHRFLTPAQTLARFGPTASSAQAVASYLRAHGFTAVTVSANRLLVTGTARAAAVEQAFHTRLADYRWDGHVVYANVTSALVPKAIAAQTAAVLGLSDMPMSLPHRAAPVSAARQAAITNSQRVAARTGKSPQSPGNFAGFYPAAVQEMYDAANLPAATRVPVAVITSGDMTPTIANLRYAESNQGFPAAPVSVVDTAAPALVDASPYTGNLEWDLDTQISTMVATDVSHLYIYDIPNLDDADVARGINTFVEADQARAGSVSVGECDFQPFLDGALLSTDQALAEGSLQGQSFFASSGDNGFACPEVASTGVPGGVPGASWPADGLYTTAVGGTTVLASNQGKVSNEFAWIGGGGGISNFEFAPAWTLQDNPAGEVASFAEGGRGVPDVAADADNNVSPVLIYGGTANGGYVGVGGTSVSSPLTMGLWAKVMQADGDPGLASYTFYRLYNAVNPGVAENTAIGTEYVPDPNPGPVAGLRDITVGTNGLFTAKPGYDYTTGVGSVQAAAMAAALKPATQAPASSPSHAQRPAPHRK